MADDARTSNLLRGALRANGVFSALSGVVLVAAAGPIAAFVGVGAPALLVGIGASLLLFAVGLFRNASRPSVNRTEAGLAVAMDLAWVAGSAFLIFAGILSIGGAWLVGIVADIVLLFAILQWVGLRRSTPSVAA